MKKRRKKVIVPRTQEGPEERLKPKGRVKRETSKGEGGGEWSFLPEL